MVQLLNYKRSGDPFINLLSVTPIYDASGTLTHYVGIQVRRLMLLLLLLTVLAPGLYLPITKLLPT